MNGNQAGRVRSGTSVKVITGFFGEYLPRTPVSTSEEDDLPPDGRQIPEGAVGTVNGYVSDDPGCLDVTFTFGTYGSIRVAAQISCIELS